MAFLHLTHFVAPSAGLSAGARWLALLAVSTLTLGCSLQPARRPVEDSLTSGRIRVVCAPEVSSLLERERMGFESLYPESKLEMRMGGAREAVRALFAAECDLAVITRELAPEERAAAVRGKLELEGYRFARDAVVIIVNAANPVENVTMEDLRALYSGEVTDWSANGGPHLRVEPVVQPAASDLTASFIAQVMSGGPIRAAAHTGSDDADVVRRVRETPGAVGYVSLAAAREGTRALRLSTMSGLSYIKPDPESVYRGDYPLTRSVNLYVRTGGPPVQNGFITYVTSQDGQRLVHEGGLVPTSIPVRFVRRSPMLSTH